MEMIDLTPVLLSWIGLLASLITARLIPWLKNRTTLEQQDWMLATVRVLVYAAEQMFGAGQGAAKLEYVQEEL